MISRYYTDYDPVEDEVMAELASNAADLSLDSYSEYGVGAAVEVEYSTPFEDQYHVYQGININLSGMENKIHAEQMAVFNALLDARRADMEEHMSINRVVVNTSENDNSLVCGHCIQVFHGVCKHLDQPPSSVDYWATTRKVLYDADGEGQETRNFFRKENLGELIEETYVHNREDN